MILSDVSVKRPVFATVISLLLVAFGILSFLELPLREYPDTSQPIVSISTSYPGASAEVVETQITQLLEDQINGIAGVVQINSQSSDGNSQISVEFDASRDIEVAANDIRDKISRVARRLPEDVDPPQIAKNDADGRAIQQFSLLSDQMSYLDLNDYANRYIIDQFSVLDGVASIQTRGNGGYAMRIWLDRVALAARGLTVNDVQSALRRENVELPAGRIDSSSMEFSVRVERVFQSPQDFARLVIGRGSDGHMIMLGEVARIELGSANERSMFRVNGVPAVGIGIIKQSTANSLTVMRAAAELGEQINATLPEHMELVLSQSDAEFIEKAIESVYHTIWHTMLLVGIVIYLFLGSLRATLIPVVTIPVCLIASFIVMAPLGLSVNLITLLALVLCVGLVVDDSIVVLENVQRRIELGEPPLLAAFNGSRQVAFAVIATTVVIIAVFVPVLFMDGTSGILFRELSITIATAVFFSAVLALSLTPMMCSKLLKPGAMQEGGLAPRVDAVFNWLREAYREALEFSLRKSWLVLAALVAVVGLTYVLLKGVPSTFAPSEDQGNFVVRIGGPEGAGLAYMQEKVDQMLPSLDPYLESGAVKNVITMVPGWGSGGGVNGAIFLVTLPPWGERSMSTQELMTELGQAWADVPGVEMNSFMRSGLTRGGGGQPVQFVIGGRTYAELAQWRDLIIERADASGMFTRLQSDYQETKPSLSVQVDKVRAADLGVSIQAIGQTLQAMMAESRVTTFAAEGEEYDVVLQAEDSQRASPSDLTNIYVRSDTSGQLIPLSNVVSVSNASGPNSLNHYNRIRAITISGGLAPGVTLGEALAFLENVVDTELPEYAQVGYKGESLDLKESGGNLAFIFGLALLVVFLVLAAQFESFVHPMVIMTTVPLAIFGALLGLVLIGGTLNIYSNIGLIILVGIAAKNGILIVEFANQLRDEGKAFHEALVEACLIRLRPVLMTALATIMGAVPLMMATGAGSESRVLLGTVIFSGVLTTTLLTLFVVPVIYRLLARNTGSPEAVTRALRQLQDGEDLRQGTGTTAATA